MCGWVGIIVLAVFGCTYQVMTENGDPKEDGTGSKVCACVCVCVCVCACVCACVCVCECVCVHASVCVCVGGYHCSRCIWLYISGQD